MRWNDELAARIREAPDDVAARVVFGDWLQQAGDPRGELVQLQARLVETPDDPVLRAREDAFLAEHRRELLGPLADNEIAAATFRYGFIDTLDVDLAGYLAARAHPSLQFVRSLQLRVRTSELGALAGALPATLASLVLVGAREARPSTPLHELVRGVGGLEEIVFVGVDVVLDLAVLRLPALRVAALESGTIATASAGWRAAVPALRHASIQLLDDPRDEAIDLFVHPPQELRMLHLWGNHTMPWLRRLLDAPLLAQLHELSLRGAHVEGGEELLVRHAARLAHLTKLDVGQTYPYLARLAALGPHVAVA